MNKKLSILAITAALSAAFCFTACVNDKPAQTTAATTAAATTSAAAQNPETEATTASESKNNDQGSENGDGIPKVGDMYKGKKVGSVEKVPDCDDDKHGVIYVYDEDEELIEAIKY